MPCVHLQQLYTLCHEHNLKLSASDLIRVACHQCDEQEVCPSVLMDEYDSRGTQEKEVEAAKPPEKTANDKTTRQ